jgi:hypothetical protein
MIKVFYIALLEVLLVFSFKLYWRQIKSGSLSGDKKKSKI